MDRMYKIIKDYLSDPATDTGVLSLSETKFTKIIKHMADNQMGDQVDLQNLWAVLEEQLVSE